LLQYGRAIHSPVLLPEVQQLLAGKTMVRGLLCSLNNKASLDLSLQFRESKC
jgi:hypothetical protein